VPALYAATEGLRIVNEVGVKTIREHSIKLTSRLLEKLLDLELPSLTPRDPARRGGTVCVNPEGSEAIARELLEHDFLIDWRPEAGIRISPHFYNTEDECDRIVAEIAALVSKRPALRTTMGD
jgi:kynureninase